MNKLHFFIALFGCVLVYILGAFSIPLMDIDASQYASISREMLETGSYLQVFDLGKDYLDKPPMLFWLSAFSMKIFGVSDFVYRLPSLVFLGFTLYSCFEFCLIFYARNIAYLATLILASSQALFLISHDVRTDTLLMGWVMLCIWQLAKWDQSNKPIHFFGAILMVAGGMLTKGPIALLVPFLAFCPYWIQKRDWKKFYHPIYILGIMLLALCLAPMSWGLYQQFDQHPGKLINGIPIESGLRFFYWTQSFGRYTGENFYREMNYPSFLLENMLWSYLPWILLFISALIYQIIQIFKNGFFKAKQETISFFGFVGVYLVLSRSQAQLPHYIFVVFPLASILTANFFYSIIDGQNSSTKFVRISYYFHSGLFMILFLFTGFLLFWPFGYAPIYIWFIWIIGVFLYLYLINQKKGLGQKWIQLSWVTMIFVNISLSLFVYPNLLRFQWGNTVVQEINNKQWPKEKIVTLGIPNSNALHFYGKKVFPSRSVLGDIQKGDWVIADQIYLDSLQVLFPRSNKLYTGYRFHISQLTFSFLNPSTRPASLIQYGVLKINP